MGKKNKDKTEQLECELDYTQFKLQRTREKLLLLALEVREAILDAKQYGVEIVNDSAAVRASEIADEILREENNQRG